MIQAICDRQFDALVDHQLAIDIWAQCSAHLRASGLASSAKEAARTQYESLDVMVKADVSQALVQTLVGTAIPEEGAGPGTHLYARVRSRLRTLGAAMKPANTPPIDRSRSLGL